MAAAKVLILMTSPLDKIVHALRVVESIKREQPELELTWVVRRFYEPLVASFDFVDRTIVFRRSEALRSFAGLIHEIRQDRYDYILDFEGYARTGAMCFFAKGGRKIGLRSAREGASICYSEIVAMPKDDQRHLFERFQDFGSVFGVKVEPAGQLPLGRSSELPEPIARLSESNGRIVSVFPGRFKSERAWAGMLDLATRLVGRYDDLEVVFVGVVPCVLGAQLPARIHDFQAQFSWPELCSVVAASEVVVANDNGPAQLAGAFEVRNLTLYSFVSAELRGSYPIDSDRNAYLRAPDGEMDRLDAEAVFSEIEKLLLL